jgi:hypothetical protein
LRDQVRATIQQPNVREFCQARFGFQFEALSKKLACPGTDHDPGRLTECEQW